MRLLCAPSPIYTCSSEPFACLLICFFVHSFWPVPTLSSCSFICLRFHYIFMSFFSCNVMYGKRIYFIPFSFTDEEEEAKHTHVKHDLWWLDETHSVLMRFVILYIVFLVVPHISSVLLAPSQFVHLTLHISVAAFNVLILFHANIVSALRFFHTLRNQTHPYCFGRIYDFFSRAILLFFASPILFRSFWIYNNNKCLSI